MEEQGPKPDVGCRAYTVGFLCQSFEMSFNCGNKLIFFSQHHKKRGGKKMRKKEDSQTFHPKGDFSQVEGMI